MGTHDFKYNKVPIFARKTGNIITSMFAAPKLALVPASRYYLRSSTEMRPKAAFRCGWNRRPIHWTSEKLSALSDVIYTVSHG